MAEPKVFYATVRSSLDGDGEEAWDIECRFDDGQKWAPVQVEGRCPELAHRIANALSSGAPDREPS